MKSKVILIGVIIAILLGVIVIVILNQNSSTFNLQNKEDGSITITAKNAGKNSGGIAQITLEEGQKLEVKANLEKKGSIKVQVTPSNTDNNAEAVLDETFKQEEQREFELPSGSYNIDFTTEKGTTGNMTVNVK